MTFITVEGLYVYPIKGCRGIRVPESSVTRAGLKWDRRFMVVDQAGQFLSQRSHPLLGQVRTALSGDALHIASTSQGELTLPRELDRGALIPVRIWRDDMHALISDEGSSWFSALLGEAVRLVYVADAELRTVNPKHAHPGDVVGFADAYPALCASTASLEELNGRLLEGSVPLTMERFRPNITLTGTSPFEEDDFAVARIGNVTFRRARLCERCVVTTLDPETGEGGKEPLRTLATYRKWDGAVWFGSNWIPEGTGSVRVGDAVEVLERTPGH
jgi:uncharacterized protein